jgi:carboxyl-terminal processing protease
MTLLRPLSLFLLTLSVLACRTSAPVNRFDAALDIVGKHYLKDVPRAGLEEQALRAFLNDLDPYSNYMNAQEWAGFRSKLTGQFCGIGVNLRIDSDARLPEISYLMLGSPAGEAGVRRGDHILRIDGHPLEGLSIDDVIPLLRGIPGSTVELTIRPAGSLSTLPLRVTRRMIKDPSVRGVRRDAAGESHYLLSEEKGIGYIRVLGLADDTVPELTKALVELKRQGMKGLVFDLRDSHGGKLHAAVDAADLFLDAGRILSVASRVAGDEVYDAKPGVLTDVPMVMLINEWTVSSSEILAGALTDNHRAIAMGQRTFGKGRIQVMYDLPPGMGGVVLSTGTFQRPSGKTIDKHDAKSPNEAGIAPDPGMEIALEAKESEAWAAETSRLDNPVVLTPEEQIPTVPDRVLVRALEVLDAAIAKGKVAGRGL